MEYFKEPANAVYQSGAKNPFLPLNIYIPDGEPKVFDGRVYLYGSKDEFDGEYCCHKFHVYSAFQMEQRVLQKARTHTDHLRMLCR